MRTARQLKLVPHTGSVSSAIRAIDVTVSFAEGTMLQLEYCISADMSRIRLPEMNPPERQEGLWNHTCLEAFVRGHGNSYCEFNFAPSGNWAAFRFDAYRSSKEHLQLSSAPRIRIDPVHNGFVLVATVNVDGLEWFAADRERKLAIASVIEEDDGSLTYWALKHPPGKADFHHRDGFVAVLEHGGASKSC